jgi:anthranilate phosphoribosyltransferase
VRVREEIGKRPPVASLELLWTPHQGDHLLVSGFVHPPTETRAWEALAAAGETDLLTVKGLEGSTDLPTTRAGITARVRHGSVERLILHPRDHGIETEEVAWHSLDHWRSAALQALQGEGELAPALRWNLGAYLWFAGQISDLPTALAQAEALMATRVGLAQLERLQ